MRMENQELYQQEQRRREQELAACSKQLSFAVRNFMTQCYLDAIPPEQFVDFWSLASFKIENAFPLVAREGTYKCLNEAEKKALDAKIQSINEKSEKGKWKKGATVDDIDNLDFAESVRRSLGKEPPYETRKALLDAADLAATFKMNTVLEQNTKALKNAGFAFYKKFSLYEILKAAYWKDRPKEDVPKIDKWKSLNSQAIRQRNRWDGHSTSQTYRTEDGELLSIQEWQRQAMNYLAVVNPLHTPRHDAEYAEIDRVMKNASRTANCSIYPLAKFTEHCSYSADQIRQIFQEYNLFECTGDSVYCVFEETLGYLRNRETQIEQNRRMSEFEDSLRRLLQIIEREQPASGTPGPEAKAPPAAQEPSLQQQAPPLPQPERSPQQAQPLPQPERSPPQRRTLSPREQLLCSKLLEEQLKDVPPIQALREYSGGPLGQSALRELVATHRILLDGSVLLHPDGRHFLSDVLDPAIRHSGQRLQDVLVIDATTMYHLMEKMQRYKQLDAALLGTQWTSAREQERARLAGERDDLHSAQSAYIFVRDRLGLSPTGIPDPLCPDDDATLEFLQINPFRRICILTCGATALPRRIDRDALPFTAVARVRAAGQMPQASIFSQFLPLTECSVDDPHLIALTQSLLPEDMLDSLQDAKDSASHQEMTSAGDQAFASAQSADSVPKTSPAPAQAENAAQKMSAPPAQSAQAKPKAPSAPAQGANTNSKAPSAPAQGAEDAPKTRTAPAENEAPVPASKPAPGTAPRTPQERAAGTTPQTAPGTAPRPPQEKAAGTAVPAAASAPKKARRYPADAPLRPLDPASLPLSASARPGDLLHTESGAPVVLGTCLLEDDEEAKGGEGALFLTDAAGQVAKLYFAGHLTAGRRDKLLSMPEGNPGLQGLCWPSHVLYNQHGEFVGYMMPQAPAGAMPFSKSVLKIGSPSQREKFMRGWMRKDLVRAAYGAARLTAGLHRNNILMGDVNAGNFMVDMKDSGRVFLVDTDSFQFDGYPCPVGVEEFTHPGTAARLGVPGELRFGTFLRTREEEEYALAILLFEILFMGVNPFISKSEMNYLDAMRQKRFPYANREEKWIVPDGDPWMIWKNLPKKICDAFTNTFSLWKTTSADTWANLLNRYLSQIERDGYSNELAPEKYHEFHPEDPWFVDVTCPKCGREFNTPKEQYAKMTNRHEPIFCRKCRQFLELHGKETYPEKRICAQCGKPYTVTVKDEMYFACGLKKPVCVDCTQPEVSCGGCGKSFRMPADLYRDRKRRNEAIVCRDCSGNETVRCEECQNSYIMPRWQAVRARRTGTRFLCIRCRNTTSVVCSCCGKTYREQNARIEQIKSRGQKLICPDCRQMTDGVCAACGESFRQERWRTEKNGQEGWPNLCASCRGAQTLRVRCTRCSKMFEMPRKTFSGRYHYNNGKILCPSCYSFYH